MTKIKVGVIGTGHLGNWHTKLLNEIENCELVGIYDLDRSKAEKVANDHGVSVIDTIDDLYSKVDAVSIVATTSAHYKLIRQAFELNKHVFVEKPITTTIEEAEEVVKMGADRNLILQVGHIERFNPALMALEGVTLDPKFIQTDRLAQFNPRGTDVAVVLDLMIHDIDVILSLIKSKVKTISASGVAVVSDTIDIANARIEFENGAVANVTASRISQKKMRKMRMFQRDAYISVDFDTGVSEMFSLVTPDQLSEGNYISFGEMGIGEKKKHIVYSQPEPKEINALKHELQLFVNSCIDGSVPIVTGHDGLRALQVAQEIIEKINAATETVS